MIRGYPRHPTVLPGGSLTLHVSTDDPTFKVEFYRVGRGMARMSGFEEDRFRGLNYPPGPTDQDWGWPAYSFAIPDGWPTGCYIAVMVGVDAAGHERRPDVTTADGVDSKALFVVRSSNPGGDSKILYKVSWATFHAYNATGYGSLYGEAVWSRDYPYPGFKVTTRRPGGGTGGVVMLGDSPDYYDPASRRQTFAHWDPPFIAWLEDNSYRVDYCTDLDLHQDRELLTPYNLLLSVGHDEYWSPEMRASIDAFVDRGGNVAYFSGNIDGWRIHFHDDDTAFTCAKVGPGPYDFDRWESDANQAGNPENRTTGVSYYAAGGWWDGKRETLGYTVQHSSHWIFEGSGLAEGDVFGDDEKLPLVGYEADGADMVMRDGIAIATGRQGTPSTFFILGVAKLGPGWAKFRDGAAATMGVFTSRGGGIVFQGATTDWPKLVGSNDKVAQITRNVLDGLRLKAVRVVGPLPPVAGRMLAAAGEKAEFVADVSPLGDVEGLHYEWRIAGATARPGDSAAVTVEMPAASAPVTVSVMVSDGEGPLGFGTRTFMPLTRIDMLRLEVVNLLREMVTPGDPSGSFVMPTFDPMLVSRGLVTVNLPWIRDRAARLAEVSAELLEIWSRDGTRPVIDDPRAPWVRK